MRKLIAYEEQLIQQAKNEREEYHKKMHEMKE